MLCAECHDHDNQAPAVALCQNCGRALCASCADSRPGPGGMHIGCRHGRESVVLASGGVRPVRAA